MKETIKMDRIEDAIADFKEGKFVIVVDDEDRENDNSRKSKFHVEACTWRTLCTCHSVSL